MSSNAVTLFKAFVKRVRKLSFIIQRKLFDTFQGKYERNQKLAWKKKMFHYALSHSHAAKVEKEKGVKERK